MQLVHVGYRRHPHFTAYVALKIHKYRNLRDMCSRFDKCLAVLNSESHASILVDVGENAVLVVVGKVGHRSIEDSAVFKQVVTCIDKFLFLGSYIMHDSDERNGKVVISTL